jgi:sulfite oxidase
MPAQRLRLLAVVGVVIVGATLEIWLASGVARVVVVVLAVGAAAMLGGFGTMRIVEAPSSDENRAVTAVDRDEAADLRDRVADLRDHVAGQRDHVAGQRDEVADHRDQAAGERDQASQHRDQAAGERDQAAEQRDQVGEQRDRAVELPEGGADVRRDAERLSRSSQARREAATDRMRASQDRGAGASGRAHAELDRDSAVGDREAAASGRAHAELDRDSAMADREAGAGERAHAELDREEAMADRSASAGALAEAPERTGVEPPTAGAADLAREIDRARGTARSLVLAFVGVHPGDDSPGDRLIDEVEQILRAQLRSYDLVFRYGSAEFVCALPSLDMAAAEQLLAHVNPSLAPGHGSVTVGLAELSPDDSAADLVARADAARHPGDDK